MQEAQTDIRFDKNMIISNLVYMCVLSVVPLYYAWEYLGIDFQNLEWLSWSDYHPFLRKLGGPNKTTRGPNSAPGP
jgi:hypothetical protein